MRGLGLNCFEGMGFDRNQLKNVLTFSSHSFYESLWHSLNAASNFTILGLRCFFFYVFHIF